MKYTVYIPGFHFLVSKRARVPGTTLKESLWSMNHSFLSHLAVCSLVQYMCMLSLGAAMMDTPGCDL